MISPKSHSYRSPQKKKYRRREHKNKKFYNSKAWKENRSAYIRAYQQRIYYECVRYYWTIRDGTKLSLSPHQVAHILSLSYVPCEQCLKLYCAEAYDTMSEGIELDHIEPLNPESALESEGYGDPFDHDNLQLLCKTHHAKKSQRER
jgi:hypothetical protein